MPGPANAVKNWIVIGDIHDEMENLERIPELNLADGIIISGDLTQLGGIAQAKAVIDRLARLRKPVLAQIGNMDKPEVNGWLTDLGINLHDGMRELSPQLVVFGIGGSTITPFGTPSEFSEEEYDRWLDALWDKARIFPHQVLISHNPPRDTKCDDIGGAHVGSTALREFLEKNQPDACICGHIHEGRATDHIGRTVIVNPGTLASGGYALLQLANGQVSASLKTIPEA